MNGNCRQREWNERLAALTSAARLSACLSAELAEVAHEVFTSIWRLWRCKAAQRPSIITTKVASDAAAPLLRKQTEKKTKTLKKLREVSESECEQRICVAPLRPLFGPPEIVKPKDGSQKCVALVALLPVYKRRQSDEREN